MDSAVASVSPSINYFRGAARHCSRKAALQKHDSVIIISAYLRANQFPSRGSQRSARLFDVAPRFAQMNHINDMALDFGPDFEPDFRPDFREDNGRII